MTNLTKALAKDPAAVNFTAVHPYGNIKFSRVGYQPGQKVTVSPDGTMTVEYPAASK